MVVNLMKKIVKSFGKIRHQKPKSNGRRDGLSSAAIEANIKEVLPAIKQGLNMYNLDFDNVVLLNIVACQQWIKLVKSLTLMLFAC